MLLTVAGTVASAGCIGLGAGNGKDLPGEELDDDESAPNSSSHTAADT